MMRQHFVVGFTCLVLNLIQIPLNAQMRDLSSLSEAETTASILTRVLLLSTSGRQFEERVFLPEVSEQALDLIIRETSEAMNARTALPRYEQEALCESWNGSDKSDGAVVNAMDAYDSARIAWGSTYAVPFVEAEADITASLAGEDLRNFQEFMNRWRATYRDSQGKSGSFFSEVIRKDPSKGKESIELQCTP